MDRPEKFHLKRINLAGDIISYVFRYFVTLAFFYRRFMANNTKTFIAYGDTDIVTGHMGDKFRQLLRSFSDQ